MFFNPLKRFIYKANEPLPKCMCCGSTYRVKTYEAKTHGRIAHITWCGNCRKEAMVYLINDNYGTME